MDINISALETLPQKRHMLVLFASPHKKGSTACLLSSFLEPLRAEMQITVVDAYDVLAAPCTACGLCKTKQACINSDLDFLDALYRQADAIVVASPVYSLTFPAPMKAILDRMQRYFEARFSLGIKPSILKPKQAVLLAACGSEDGTEIMERQLKMVFSVMNTKLIQSVVWKNTDLNCKKDRDQALQSARDLAIAIYKKTCYSKM